MSPAVTPAMIDAILLAVAVELVAVSVWLRRASAQRLIAPFLLYLASGAALLGAVRVALSDAASPGVALALVASLGCHVASLWSLQRLCLPRLELERR